MSRFDDFVPRHIRELPDYLPGKPRRQAERESGLRCIKMASNENPWGPSPRALQAIAQAVGESNFYPENFNDGLRITLAEKYNISPEEVLVTDGSTSFLDIIAHTLLAPGKNAVTSERSFLPYANMTRMSGGQLIQAPMQDGAHYDPDALLAAINDETRIVWFANPNNPTGTLLPVETVDRFVERVPPHVLVVLDEAYSDFAEHYCAPRGLTYSHALDHVRSGRNVVVLRTFSKVHGLAGLRIGYGFARRDLTSYFAHVRTPFSVSGVGEAAALAALADTDHIRKTLESNTREVERLLSAFRELGLKAIPSVANFITFEVAEDAAGFTKRMQEHGIILRLLAAWGMPSSIRVSVGTPTQNDAFLAALRQCLPVAARSVKP